jgi:hypothetical protein
MTLRLEGLLIFISDHTPLRQLTFFDAQHRFFRLSSISKPEMQGDL